MAESLPVNEIDVHVGKRVRARRKALGVSQEALGDYIGISFQQVQKYERGANRISASTLYYISKKLETNREYWFDGLTEPEDEHLVPGAPPTGSPAPISGVEIDMLADFRNLQPSQRRMVAALVHDLRHGPKPSADRRTHR